MTHEEQEQLNRALKKKYIEIASRKYIKRMKGLDKDLSTMPGYLPDPAHTPRVNHLTYRVGAPLESLDGERLYEFLIEYHKGKPSEGIYYGVRGFTKEGFDHQKEIEEHFMKDWAAVENEVVTALNNSFPGKDFSQRLRLTDNANDSTYWLRWITLNDDEDICEVAKRSVTIMRAIFVRYLRDPKNYQPYKKPKTHKSDPVAFSNANYEKLLEVMGATYNSETPKEQAEALKNAFEDIMKRMVEKKWLSIDTTYEKAYRYARKSKGAELATILNAIFLNLYERGLYKKHHKNNPDSYLVPWQYLERLFLSEDGIAFIGLRQQYGNCKRDDFDVTEFIGLLP